MSERIRRCPECGSMNIVLDSEHAELYCANCGVVLAEDIPDLGLERHTGVTEYERLILDLEGYDNHLRERAAKRFGKIGDKRAVKPLIQALEDDDSDVKQAAAYALIEIGDLAVDPLIQAMEDEDCHVRDWIAYTLKWIGDERALNPLIHALYDDDVDVREEAKEALGMMSEIAVGQLIKNLKDRPSDNKWVLMVLEEMGDKAIEPLIKYYLEDIGLRQLLSKVLNKANLRLPYLISEIDRVANELDLPMSVKIEASLICWNVVKKKIHVYRGYLCAAYAALYIAARPYLHPQTQKEIAKVALLPFNDIKEAYFLLAFGSEIKLPPPPDPAFYIPRFCSKLGLSEEIRERAIEILTDDQGTGVAKGSIGTAAAAIYIAAMLSGEKITKKEIAKVAGTSQITIQDRYRELVSRLNIDLSASGVHSDDARS